MRILITNNMLNSRGGTEPVVRDLARVLQGRGHSVLAYSSDEAQRDRLLENDQVPVACDLENLPFLPDIIHGLHHLDVMSALAALPGVPALYHSHGSIRQCYAPRHPRIYRYLVASRMRGERMSEESDIPDDGLAVFPASLDLTRFDTVRQLPERPGRALFFNNRQDTGSEMVSAVSEAASRCRLELSFLDRYFDRNVDGAEDVIPGYDIVFASGQSALEAIVCGCAVVVCGSHSCGEMVHPCNLDPLCEMNFSVPDDSPLPSAEQIILELERYAVTSSMAVTEKIRRAVDLESAVDDLLALYEQVIKLHRTDAGGYGEESPALARYLQDIMPRLAETEQALGRTWISSTRPTTFEELSSRLALVEQRLKTAP